MLLALLLLIQQSKLSRRRQKVIGNSHLGYRITLGFGRNLKELALNAEPIFSTSVPYVSHPFWGLAARAFKFPQIPSYSYR